MRCADKTLTAESQGCQGLGFRWYMCAYPVYMYMYVYVFRARVRKTFSIVATSFPAPWIVYVCRDCPYTGQTSKRFARSLLRTWEERRVRLWSPVGLYVPSLLVILAGVKRPYVAEKLTISERQYRSFFMRVALTKCISSSGGGQHNGQF